mgnify:CR=1 FL=1
MIFNAENILLIGSILLFVSIVVSKTGYRFGIPTLLVFLLVGMLFGSDGLGLQFHDAGEAQFIGMMALSIILFSGGMDTKIFGYQACIATRHTAFHLRRVAYYYFHRILIIGFRVLECQHYHVPDDGHVAGGYHVLYGLCFRIQISCARKSMNLKT